MRTSKKIFLASASPRRHALLARLIGRDFTVHRHRHDERRTSESTPRRRVLQCALAKARSVAGDHPKSIVIGADTIVIVGGRILGKPKDARDAVRMLKMIGGRTVTVLTGVAVVGADDGTTASGVEVSKVVMRALSDDAIRRYVRTGEPLDKAGAFAIQDKGAALVVKILGDRTNVIGLPLPLLRRLLKKADIPIGRRVLY